MDKRSTDKIIIEDLEIYAHHGVYPEEREKGQTFLISLVLLLDLEKAARCDDLNATADYSEICSLVKWVMQSENCLLIEAAAYRVIEAIFRKYDGINSVKVLLKKPYAPMDHILKFAAVEMERTREEFLSAIGQ